MTIQTTGLLVADPILSGLIALFIVPRALHVWTLTSGKDAPPLTARGDLTAVPT